MADRRSAARLQMNAAPRGDDIASFMRTLSSCAIIHGRVVTVTLDGTGNAENFRHGLGRVYVGAIYIGGINSAILMGIADAATTITAGYDPAIYFRVNPDIASASRCSFWVF